MTEQHTDQNTDDTAEVVDQTDTPETETTEPAPEVDEGKEAAKYRRRLRETEKERDALLEQVENLRRAAIDSEVASKHRIPTEGFWATGVTVDQLLTDDGTIDPAKVAATVDDAVTRLGVSHPRNGNIVPREGNNPRVRASDRWTNAFTAK